MSAFLRRADGLAGRGGASAPMPAQPCRDAPGASGGATRDRGLGKGGAVGSPDGAPQGGSGGEREGSQVMREVGERG